MSTIPWDPSLETGDPMIDGHHRELFSIVNDLRDACVADSARSAIDDILGRLMSYVATHFHAEEELMFSAGYPFAQTQAHIEAHGKLRAKALEVVGEYRAGRMVTVLPLAEFLFDWLRTHIRDTDAQVVAYIRARAAEA